MWKTVILSLIMCTPIFGYSIWGCTHQEENKVIVQNTENKKQYILETDDDYNSFYNEIEYGVPYKFYCEHNYQAMDIRYLIRTSSRFGKGTQIGNVEKAKKYNGQEEYRFELVFER